MIIGNTTLSTTDLITLYDQTFLGGGWAVLYGEGSELVWANRGFAVFATTELLAIPLDSEFAIFAEAAERAHRMYPDSDGLGGQICSSGHLHLYPFEIVRDRERAKELVRIRGQGAIFELTSGQEITF